MELVAVAVQFFDRHGSDDQTELSEEDVARHLLNVGGFESEEAFGGVVHRVALGRNTDRETTRHVDANVLSRKGVGQIGFDGNGREAQIGIILNDGPNKGTATVNALGRAVRSARAEDDQDLIGRATTITIEECGKHDDRTHYQNYRKEERRHNYEWFERK